LSGVARIYPMLLLGAGLAGLVFAFGALPTDALARLLRPDDAAAMAPVMAAGRQHRALLLVLAGATTLGALLARAALRLQDLRRVILLIAALSVGWTGYFEYALHPALAETASLKEFLAATAAGVPRDAPLFAAFPPDPGLRFYAPRRLERWP